MRKLPLPILQAVDPGPDFAAAGAGVDRFLKDALSAGAKVGVLAATNSAPRERIAQVPLQTVPGFTLSKCHLYLAGSTSTASHSQPPTSPCSFVQPCSQGSGVQPRLGRGDEHPLPRWRQDNRPAAANAMCNWDLLKAWATQASS